MKKYTAFFPGAQLNRIGHDEKEAFYLGILAYDTILKESIRFRATKRTAYTKDKLL